MTPRIRAFLWILTAVLFAYDCYVWGGLRDTPEIGPRLVKEARYESPLAATYMLVGTHMNKLIGRTEEASRYASRKFPALVLKPEQLDYLAVARTKAAQGVLLSTSYHGAPLLLVLSFLAHFVRQKQIRSFGTRG
jgi:hypothetical protein